MTRDTADPPSALAERLLRSAERSSPDAYYRLARLVARVLASTHLRRRRKWCDLARSLARSPGVEDRLVRQALAWLKRPPRLSR